VVVVVFGGFARVALWTREIFAPLYDFDTAAWFGTGSLSYQRHRSFGYDFGAVMTTMTDVGASSLSSVSLNPPRSPALHHRRHTLRR
jgi:hypothetical protein